MYIYVYIYIYIYMYIFMYMLITTKGYYHMIASSILLYADVTLWALCYGTMSHYITTDNESSLDRSSDIMKAGGTLMFMIFVSYVNVIKL